MNWKAARRAAKLLAAAVVPLALTSCGDASLLLSIGGQSGTPQTIVLVAQASGPASVRLEWTSAGGRLAYQVERDGEPIARTSGFVLVDAALQPGQRYCWRVYAYSGFGWAARSNEACVGTDAPAGWRHETLGAGRAPAVAVGAAGDVHVCHFRAGDGIVHRRVGPGQAAERVDVDGQAQCSIAVDGAGVVHIAYLSRFGLRHASNAGGRWSAATVDAEATAPVQQTDAPALVLGSDGLPRIAYRRLTGAGGAAVAVAIRRSAGWSIELTGLAGFLGPRSLAVDPAGANWLALIDPFGQSASLWRREASGWIRAWQRGLAPTRGLGAPVAIDSAGRAATAWWRRAALGTAPATLSFSILDAAGPRDEALLQAADVGYRIALAPAAGAAGHRIAWVDAAGSLQAATPVAGGWNVDVVDGQSGVAESLDLAVAPDGEWRIVHDLPLAGTVVLVSRRP